MSSAVNRKTFLILKDGSIYSGDAFGSQGTVYGEVVFNTSMYGYQEMLTDPSYAGQILVLTYPLIGNYGINRADFESNRVQVRGLIVREHCAAPSHSQNELSIHEFLNCHGIPGLSGIDTRALVRRLRVSGVMMGILTSEMSPEEALAELQHIPDFEAHDYVKSVTAGAAYTLRSAEDNSRFRIAILDCGLKYNITRILTGLGCECIVLPCNTSAADVLELEPDGILLSPGPGDPAHLSYIEENVKRLLGSKPILGICLGHQIIARALGASTFKLKFGHRGGNHPVFDLKSGTIKITSQNHGYAVDAGSIKNGLRITQINFNDGTVEGLSHSELPILSIQYHAEGSPGPVDSLPVFSEFLDMVEEMRIIKR